MILYGLKDPVKASQREGVQSLSLALPADTRQMGEGRGLKSMQVKQSIPVRNWLDRVAEAMGEVHPGYNADIEDKKSLKSLNSTEGKAIRAYKYIWPDPKSNPSRRELEGSSEDYNPYWQSSCGKGKQRSNMCLSKEEIAQKLFEYGLWSEEVPTGMSRNMVGNIASSLVGIEITDESGDK